MNKIILPSILTTICLFISACGLMTGDAPNMNEIFDDMKEGVMNEDEARFKKHWSAEGYTEDLVGEGLSGERFYRQGSRKKFYPIPDPDGAETVGSVEIVPARLHAWEKERDVDKIYFAIADGKVLGGGENPENVRKFAEKFGD